MKKYLIVFVALIVMFAVLTFYTGVKRETALTVLNSTPWIANQHFNAKILDEDLHILPVPFGALVSTYEGMWFITFRNQIFW